MATKLDMDAYDILDWDFIRKCFSNLGVFIFG